MCYFEHLWPEPFHQQLVQVQKVLKNDFNFDLQREKQLRAKNFTMNGPTHIACPDNTSRALRSDQSQFFLYVFIVVAVVVVVARGASWRHSRTFARGTAEKPATKHVKSEDNSNKVAQQSGNMTQKLKGKCEQTSENGKCQMENKRKNTFKDI